MRALGPSIESQDCPLRLLDAELFDDHRSHVEDLPGQRDPRRTNRFAGIAGQTKALRPGRRLEPMVKTGHDQTNRPSVDVAKCVTTDFPVRWTDIRACRTADTMQRFNE